MIEKDKKETEEKIKNKETNIQNHSDTKPEDSNGMGEKDKRAIGEVNYKLEQEFEMADEEKDIKELKEENNAIKGEVNDNRDRSNTDKWEIEEKEINVKKEGSDIKVDVENEEKEIKRKNKDKEKRKWSKNEVDDKRGRGDMDSKARIENEGRKVERQFRRCTGCWLLSYCDESCQREHWYLVHRYHCPFLSGKKKMDDQKDDSCAEWMDDKIGDNNDDHEIYDINSPKIGCRSCWANEESKQMRMNLGHLFGYHSCRPSCNCSLNFALEHPYPNPFPIGKVPGRLVCIWLDNMLMQAATLSKAMIAKMMNSEVKEQRTIELLIDLKRDILHSRMLFWRLILIVGNCIWKAFFEIFEKPKDNLDQIFGENDNPWWEALRFSLDLILSVSESQDWNYNFDTSSFKDADFVRYLENHNDQIRNVSYVSENNLWHQFYLWPTRNEQSLMLCTPINLHCDSCNADLGGQPLGGELDDDQVKSRPIMIPRLSKNGEISACCPEAKNAGCLKDYLAKHMFNVDSDEYTKKLKYEVEDFKKKARYCQLCLKLRKSSHRCADCESVQYCSMECAKKDMKFHDTVCSTWAKDPAKKIMSRGKQRKRFA